MKGKISMLTHPTLENLKRLKLLGMVKALEEQMNMAGIAEMEFFDRLGLLVDREIMEIENRRLKRKLDAAKLKQSACMEDIDYRHPRDLDKALMASLASCQWIASHRNILITGPTGVGKTYIACALAHKSCREGYSAVYKRTSRLLYDLAMGRADGSYRKIMSGLAKASLLILDDWGMAPLSTEQKHDILEVIEDRNGARSTVITSQLPVSSWHEYVQDPTVADALLDRLVHNAYRIELKGDSMRKKQAAGKEGD
jgi:DNA replication protein DnaC